MLNNQSNWFSAGSGNHVFGEISDSDRELLKPHLQEIVLPAESVLCERDRTAEHLYFPRCGTASLVVQLSDGSTVELATIGRDGVLGSLAALGVQHALATAVVGIELRALRIATNRLLDILPRTETLRRVLVADAGRLMFQVQQLCGCNALHPIEKRLARLLLRVADCLDSNIIPLTQEMMSQSLGVQRTTVNLVIRMMANIGAVRCRRGHVEIIDRLALQTRSCECYASVRDRLGGARATARDRLAHGQVADVAT
jgi:CRP-like cAMP-binding protein